MKPAPAALKELQKYLRAVGGVPSAARRLGCTEERIYVVLRGQGRISKKLILDVLADVRVNKVDVEVDVEGLLREVA